MQLGVPRPRLVLDALDDPLKARPQFGDVVPDAAHLGVHRPDLPVERLDPAR